jgi:hypothetical protein
MATQNNEIIKKFLAFRNSAEYKSYPKEVQDAVRAEVRQTLDYLTDKRMSGPAYEKTGFESVAEDPISSAVSAGKKAIPPVVGAIGGGAVGSLLGPAGAAGGAAIGSGLMQKLVSEESPIAVPALSFLENPINRQAIKTGGAIAGGVVGTPAGGPVGSTAGALAGYEAAKRALQFAGLDGPDTEFLPDVSDPSTAYKVGQAVERTVVPAVNLATDLSIGTVPFLMQMGNRMAAAAREKSDAGLPVEDAIVETAKENAPTMAALGLGPVASKLAPYLPTKALQTAVDYSVPVALSGMAAGEAGRIAGEVGGEMSDSSAKDQVLEFFRRGGGFKAIEAGLFPGLHMAGNRAKARAETKQPPVPASESPAPIVEPAKPPVVVAPEKITKRVIKDLNAYDVPAEQQVSVIRNITGRADAGFDNLTQNEASAVRAAIAKKMRKNTQFSQGDFGTERLVDFPEQPIPFQEPKLPAFPKEQTGQPVRVVDRRAAPEQVPPAASESPAALSQAGVARPVGLGRPIERTSVQEVVARLREQMPQEQSPADRRAVAQPEPVGEPTRPESKPAVVEPAAAGEAPAVEPPSVQIVKNAGLMERYRKARSQNEKTAIQKEWDALTPERREEAMLHIKDKEAALPIWRDVDKAVIEGRDATPLMNRLGALDPVAVNEARKLIPEPSRLDVDMAKMRQKEKAPVAPSVNAETPVMDTIESLGRIKSKGAQGSKAKGEYDAQTKLDPDYQAKVLTSKDPNAFTSDQMARELQTKGIGDGTTETMWRLIESESKGRKAGKAAQGKLLDPEMQGKAWERDGSQVVQSTDLKVGEEFTVKGEKFKVIEENDSSLKLKDGVEIDVPYEGKDAKIRIDKGSLKGNPVEAPAPGPEMMPAPAEKSMQNRPLYSVEYLVAKGLSKALKFGTNLLRQGVTDFVGWSKKMASTFGDKVKGQLVALWKAAKNGFMGQVEGRRGAVGERPNNKQKRALTGGERGANGEWYEGGKFIATKDFPKRVKQAIDKASTGKVQFEPGYGPDKWVVPEPGKVSILDSIGGTSMGPNGELNRDYIARTGFSPEQVKEIETAASKFKDGERWVDASEFPQIAKGSDVLRMINAGMKIPDAIVKRFADIGGPVKEALDIYLKQKESSPSVVDKVKSALGLSGIEGRRGGIGFRGFDRNTIKKGVDISREAVRQEERAKMPDKAAVKKGVDIAVAAGKEQVQERMNARLEKKQTEADALRGKIRAIRQSGKSLEEKRAMLTKLAQEGIRGNRDFIRALGLVKKAKTEMQVDKAARQMAEIIATGVKDREWRREFDAAKKAFQRVNKEKGKMHPVFQAVLGDKIKGVTDASPTVEKQTDRFLEKASKLLKDENVRGMMLEAERFGETVANLRNKKSLRDMSADDLRELRETVQYISHNSRTSDKLRFEGKMQDVNEVADQMYAAAEKVKEPLRTDEKPVDGSFRKEKNQGYLGQLETSLNSLPALARKVFGKVGEKVLGRDFWKAENKATELIEKGNDTVSEWRKSFGFTNDKTFQDWQNEQVTIESSGVLPTMDAPKLENMKSEKVTLTRGEFLDLVAAIGDRSTRLRLMGKDGKGGNPVVLGNTSTAKRFILSEADMARIEASLTPQEKAAVASLKKYLTETLVPEMDKAHVELMGYPLKKIEGYWPRRPSQSFSQTGLNETFNNMLAASYEALGMLKERQEHNKPLVVGNFMDTFSRHVNSGSEMASFGVPMRNARMVLGNPKVKLSFDKYLGKNVADTIDHVLTNVLLRSQKGIDPATGAFGNLQKRAGRAALAFNPLSGLRGLTGAGNLITEFSAADLAVATKKVSSNRKAIVEELQKHPYFRRRSQMLGEAIISTDAELPDLQSQRRQYSLIMGADNIVSAIAWEAAKRKIARGNPGLSGKALMDAVALDAEAAVRKTQNPVSILDSAPMIQEWGKDATKKAAVMFRSQGPKNIEVLRRINDRYRDGEINGQQALGELLTVIASQQIGKRISMRNALALGGSAAALAGLMKKDEPKNKKKEESSLAKVLGSEVADIVINQADNVPVLGFFAGNAPDLLGKYFEGNLTKTDVEQKSSPGITAVQDSLESVLNLAKAAQAYYSDTRVKGSKYKLGEQKYKKPLLTGITSGIKAGAALTGSSLFFGRLISNIVDAAGRDALGMEQSENVKQIKKLLK